MYRLRGRGRRWPPSGAANPDTEGSDSNLDPPIDGASTYLRVDEGGGRKRRGRVAATLLQITSDGEIAREIPVDEHDDPLGLVWPWEYGVYNDSAIPRLLPGSADFTAFWTGDIPSKRVPVAEFADVHRRAAAMYPARSRPSSGPGRLWLALPGWLVTVLAVAWVAALVGVLAVMWLAGVVVVVLVAPILLPALGIRAVARRAVRFVRGLRGGPAEPRE